MAYLYTDFLLEYPEFSDRDALTVERTFNQALIESNGYAGLDSEVKRNYAIGLLTAHLITLELRSESPVGGTGLVKRLESREEKITYATGDLNPMSLESTLYGARLQGFLSRQYMGGLLI